MLIIHQGRVNIHCLSKTEKVHAIKNKIESSRGKSPMSLLNSIAQLGLNHFLNKCCDNLGTKEVGAQIWVPKVQPIYMQSGP